MIAVMIAGYLIETSASGETIVYYTLPNGKRVSKAVPIKDLIKNYLTQHTERLKYILDRFDSCDTEALAKDKEIMQLVEFMNEEDIKIPTSTNTEGQFKHFYHTQLINCYNKIHGTNIKLEELI